MSVGQWEYWIPRLCFMGILGFVAQPLSAAFTSGSGIPSQACACQPTVTRSLYEREADFTLPEKLRIRKHLAQVQETLSVGGNKSLTASQQANRAQILQWLDEYREQGQFPRNIGQRKNTGPIFMDAQDIPCAVGYLLIRSGRRDLAMAIRDWNNLAYIPEIDWPELSAWANQYGLTLDECAMIQPAYCPEKNPDWRSDAFKDIRTVAADPAGNIWIGSFHGGLAQLDKGNWKVHPQLLTWNGDKRATRIGFSHDNTWVEVQRKVYSANSGFTSPLPSTELFTTDANGEIWTFSHESGLVEGFGDSAIAHPLGDPKPDWTLPIFLEAAPDGALWVGSLSNFGYYFQNQWHFFPVDQLNLGSVSGLAFGMDGTVLAGSFGMEFGIYYECEEIFSRQGLTLMRRDSSLSHVQSYHHANSPLPSNKIWSVYFDAAEKLFWIATDKGLVRFDGKDDWQTFSSPEGSITSVTRDAIGNYWFGTRDNRLLKWASGEWTSIPAPSPPASLRGPMSAVLSPRSHGHFASPHFQNPNSDFGQRFMDALGRFKSPVE